MFQIGYAQTTIDSLVISLDKEQNIDKKSKLYSDIAWEYIITENDSALIYANEALKFAKKNKSKLGIVMALETKGLYQEIIKEDYVLASKFYFEGITICEKENLSYATSIYHTLGGMFHSSDNYEKAEKYYTIAYERAKEEENIIIQKKCLINLGSIYSTLKNYEKAESFLLESLTLNIRNDYDFSTYANLGNLYFRQKKYNKALFYIEKATEQLPDNIDSEENLHFLINVKTALRDSTGMKKIISRALAFIKKTNLKRPKSLILMSISNYYKEFGNYKTALKFRDEYSVIYEEIITQYRDQTVYDLETKYQTDKQQLIIDKNKTSRKFYFIIFSLVGLIFLYLIFSSLKNNKILETKNNIIAKALTENEMLFKETHHRVKNNLQVISSLLSMQQRQIKEPLAQKAIQESRNRVKSMALIHQNLYKESNLNEVDIKNYINNLVDSLITNYKVQDKNIKVNSEIDDVKIDMDSIIPIGLIINELVSNILKYAFIGKKSGTITLNLFLIKNELRLIVADNGVGMPENFTIEESNSLGFRLVKAFSQKLEAKMEIKSLLEGTEISIIIPSFKDKDNING